MPTIVVDVMPKAELLDPQGKAVAGALTRLGLGTFSSVRIGKRFELTLHLEQVPPDPRTGPLLQRLLAGERDPAVARDFSELWQDRVRRIVVDHIDDERLVTLI